MDDFDLLLNVCSSSLSYCPSSPATKNIKVVAPLDISSPRTTKTVCDLGALGHILQLAQMQER